MEVRVRCTDVGEAEFPDQLGGTVRRATFASIDGVTIPKLEIFGDTIQQFEATEVYVVEIREA